jgi:hypothetical protein
MCLGKHVAQLEGRHPDRGSAARDARLRDRRLRHQRLRSEFFRGFAALPIRFAPF